MLPVTENAQAAEGSPLDVNEAFGKFRAAAADLEAAALAAEEASAAAVAVSAVPAAVAAAAFAAAAPGVVIDAAVFVKTTQKV